jgi:hypothetical protein
VTARHVLEEAQIFDVASYLPLKSRVGMWQEERRLSESGRASISPICRRFTVHEPTVRGQRFVVRDLAGLDFIDGSALQVIGTTAKQILQSGGSIWGSVVVME